MILKRKNRLLIFEYDVLKGRGKEKTMKYIDIIVFDHLYEMD